MYRYGVNSYCARGDLAQVFAQGRRIVSIFFTILIVRIGPVVTLPVVKWFDYWSAHRSMIVSLTIVNTLITTTSEVGSRTIISNVTGAKENGFIVKAPDGSQRVHRQSLINILMTVLASLLGGPIYFISRRHHRFFFFISFGIFNSILAQSMSSIFIDGFLLIVQRRLFFDFVYNASIKFLLFEYVRPHLLKHRASPGLILGFRITQDFLTTSMRVIILNILRLSGH